MNHIQIKIFKLYRSGSFRSTNKVFFIITLFILFFLKPTYSQNTQIWLDADVYPSFSVNWDYKVEAGYRQYLVSEGWKRYHLRNVFTYKKFNWILFAGALDLFYTNEDISIDYL